MKKRVFAAATAAMMTVSALGSVTIKSSAKKRTAILATLFQIRSPCTVRGGKFCTSKGTAWSRYWKHCLKERRKF